VPLQAMSATAADANPPPDLTLQLSLASGSSRAHVDVTLRRIQLHDVSSNAWLPRAHLPVTLLLFLPICMFLQSSSPPKTLLPAAESRRFARSRCQRGSLGACCVASDVLNAATFEPHVSAFMPEETPSAARLVPACCPAHGSTSRRMCRVRRRVRSPSVMCGFCSRGESCCFACAPHAFCAGKWVLKRQEGQVHCSGARIS
jgi:hypothetical protein